MADYNNDDEKKAGGSDMECVTAATHIGKCQVRPATDHFKRLLEEACLNNSYPLKNKLKDYDMMKNFMTL
jgi:hypothetical protein